MTKEIWRWIEGYKGKYEEGTMTRLRDRLLLEKPEAIVITQQFLTEFRPEEGKPPPMEPVVVPRQVFDMMALVCLVGLEALDPNEEIWCDE